MNLSLVIQNNSGPLSPIETGITPRISELSEITVVLFDIYGTLLISASGDVESDPSIDRSKAVVESLNSTLKDWPDKIDSEITVQLFEAAIVARHEELRASGTEFPEVDIRDIWRQVWKQFLHREWIDSTEAFDNATEQFAVEYEVRVNPIWPMPDCKETIENLANSRRLGIISNAQFITPQIFPALMGKSLEEFGFDRSLQFYSFEYEQAKPGIQLYELAVAALGRLKISPEQVLYVGNDMLKDIAPAHRVGFKTALFAGDQRSLRMREQDPEVTGITPDLVVTKLPQIMEALG